MEKAKPKQNIHSGHRVRLMELANRIGFENLTNIQQVELVLCYVFPRGDVNPLAHRLLDRYNTLPTILEAPIQDLQLVEGMAYRSALKLHNILGIYNGYVVEKATPKEPMATLGDVLDYVEKLLRFKNKEEVHILGVSDQGEVIADRCLAMGSHSKVSIELRDISFFIATFGINSAILVHNHPNGKCQMSDQDLATHIQLEGIFRFAGCCLWDDLIVGKDGIFSLKDKCKRRIFATPSQLESLLDELQNYPPE